jgi:hypothetical protein
MDRSALMLAAVLAGSPLAAPAAAQASTDAPAATAGGLAVDPAAAATPKPRTVRIGERTVAVDSLAADAGAPGGSTRSVRAPASSNARPHRR